MLSSRNFHTLHVPRKKYLHQSSSHHLLLLLSLKSQLTIICHIPKYVGTYMYILLKNMKKVLDWSDHFNFEILLLFKKTIKNVFVQNLCDLNFFFFLKNVICTVVFCTFFHFWRTLMVYCSNYIYIYKEPAGFSLLYLAPSPVCTYLEMLFTSSSRLKIRLDNTFQRAAKQHLFYSIVPTIDFFLLFLLGCTS